MTSDDDAPKSQPHQVTLTATHNCLLVTTLLLNLVGVALMVAILANITGSDGVELHAFKRSSQ